MDHPPCHPHTKSKSAECKGCIEKNSSPTLTRDKANIEYISGGQSSPYELAFGVELGSNPHFKTY